jgi:hypothetical protein
VDAAAADTRGRLAVDGHAGGASADVAADEEQPPRTDVDHRGVLGVPGFPDRPQCQPAHRAVRGGEGQDTALRGDKGDLTRRSLTDQLHRFVEHDRPFIRPGADQDPVPGLRRGHRIGHRREVPSMHRVDDAGRRRPEQGRVRQGEGGLENVPQPAGQIDDRPTALRVGQRLLPLDPQIPPVGVLAGGKVRHQAVVGVRAVQGQGRHRDPVHREDQVGAAQALLPVEETLQLPPALVAGQERRADDGDDEGDRVQGVVDPVPPRLSPGDVVPILEDS